MQRLAERDELRSEVIVKHVPLKDGRMSLQLETAAGAYIDVSSCDGVHLEVEIDCGRSVL